MTIESVVAASLLASSLAASTITNVSSSMVNGDECIDTTLCNIVSYDGVGHFGSSYAQASVGNFSVFADADGAGSNGYKSKAQADAWFEQMMTFDNGVGSGTARFTFFVSTPYIFTDKAPGTYSASCFFGTCYTVSVGDDPLPETFVVDKPFTYGVPFDFNIEAKAYFDGFDDPGGMARSMIVLKSTELIPTPVQVPEVSSGWTVLLGLGLLWKKGRV